MRARGQRSFTNRLRVLDEGMETSPPIEKFSFGICNFGRTLSNLNTLSPNTQILNIEIAFEEALKLNLAINECVRKLNSYKRSATAGKRSGLNLFIQLSTGVITVNEAKLPNP
jgi:hypothetical protein